MDSNEQMNTVKKALVRMEIEHSESEFQVPLSFDAPKTGIVATVPKIHFGVLSLILSMLPNVRTTALGKTETGESEKFGFYTS